MENKILNDAVLENVSGGQAVLPLLSNTKEVDEQMLNLSYKGLHCPSCRHQFAIVVPPSGKVTCPECQYEFTVTT